MRTRKIKLDQYDLPQNEVIQDDPKQYSQYSKSIGEIMICFSELEYVLDKVLVESISDRSDRGYMYIKGLRMRDKIEIFKQLGLDYINIEIEHFKLTKSKLLSIISKLKELNTFRNRVAHANWMTLSKDGFVRTKVFYNNEDGQTEFIEVKMTEELMKKYIIKIRDMTFFLYDKVVI